MSTITYYLDGNLYLLTGCPGLSDDDMMLAVPSDAQNIETHTELTVPEDAIFMSTWQLQGSTIVEDLTASKEVAHEIRRTIRDREFIPWDRKVTIPPEAANAEAQRELIREKYAQIQTDIDIATDMATLRTVVKSFI